MRRTRAQAAAAAQNSTSNEATTSSDGPPAPLSRPSTAPAGSTRRPVLGGAATSTNNIVVAVRIRPPNVKELQAGRAASKSGMFRRIVEAVDSKMLVFDPSHLANHRRSLPGRTGSRAKDTNFTFDRVFPENSAQQQVYEGTTKDLVPVVLSGRNATVFAYGATGSGKTHTMIGNHADPGVMVHTMRDIFKAMEEKRDTLKVRLTMSYLEVYNEQIRDLLSPNAGQGTDKPLGLREDPARGVTIAGLSEHNPTSPEQVMELLARGNAARTMAGTGANAVSSRSHAVLQVVVRSEPRTAGTSRAVATGKLSLIDLAGSERAAVTQNRGERLVEGANINRSLLALGNCINALVEGATKGSTYIPYRDSKLTRLLKDSLGGNCLTVMIAAIGPSSLSYEDTHNTLKYANRAKNIKTKVSTNVVAVDVHIAEYTRVIDDLRAEVAELKARAASQKAAPLPPPGPPKEAWNSSLQSALSQSEAERLMEELSAAQDKMHEARLELAEANEDQAIYSRSLEQALEACQQDENSDPNDTSKRDAKEDAEAELASAKFAAEAAQKKMNEASSEVLQLREELDAIAGKALESPIVQVHSALIQADGTRALADERIKSKSVQQRLHEVSALVGDFAGLTRSLLDFAMGLIGEDDDGGDKFDELVSTTTTLLEAAGVTKWISAASAPTAPALAPETTVASSKILKESMMTPEKPFVPTVIPRDVSLTKTSPQPSQSVSSTLPPAVPRTSDASETSVSSTQGAELPPPPPPLTPVALPPIITTQSPEKAWIGSKAPTPVFTPVAPQRLSAASVGSAQSMRTARPARMSGARMSLELTSVGSIAPKTPASARSASLAKSPLPPSNPTPIRNHPSRGQALTPASARSFQSTRSRHSVVSTSSMRTQRNNGVLVPNTPGTPLVEDSFALSPASTKTNRSLAGAKRLSGASRVSASSRASRVSRVSTASTRKSLHTPLRATPAPSSPVEQPASAKAKPVRRSSVAALSRPSIVPRQTAATASRAKAAAAARKSHEASKEPVKPVIKAAPKRVSVAATKKPAALPPRPTPTVSVKLTPPKEAANRRTTRRSSMLPVPKSVGGGRYMTRGARASLAVQDRTPLSPLNGRKTAPKTRGASKLGPGGQSSNPRSAQPATDVPRRITRRHAAMLL